MTDYRAKICIIGNFAVGKTSTVERFVNNQFSEKYLTTIGVKVDTKDLLVDPGVNLKLVIWDIAGTDRFGDIEFNYLRGASGCILVADGTRQSTVSEALGLKEQVEDRYGDMPFVFLLNKSDLKHAWEVSDEQLDTLRETAPQIFVTSAKTGSQVDEAIASLGNMVAKREFLDS